MKMKIVDKMRIGDDLYLYASKPHDGESLHVDISEQDIDEEFDIYKIRSLYFHTHNMRDKHWVDESMFYASSYTDSAKLKEKLKENIAIVNFFVGQHRV